MFATNSSYWFNGAIEKNAIILRLNQIPVCQHGRTDNNQIVLGDRLLDQSWYQVDNFHCGPVKKNFMMQYGSSPIGKLFTEVFTVNNLQLNKFTFGIWRSRYLPWIISRIICIFWFPLMCFKKTDFSLI